MRITVDGHLRPGVTAKDVALYIISRMTTSGATGYFVEYAGEVVRDMSMEERMTLCNLSIEMGARGGMVAPDETTFAYLKGRDFAPKDDKWDEAVAYWRTLPTDDDAVFDAEVRFDAADIEPRVTFGTNPGWVSVFLRLCHGIPGRMMLNVQDIHVRSGIWDLKRERRLPVHGWITCL